jgi:hypothetical protein
LKQNPEAIACVNDECSYRANPDWIRMGERELMKIQAVETNETSICSYPEITIGSLCNGRYRSPRPTPLNSPRVVDILRHGLGWIERRRRNGEAGARESGNGAPE